MITTDLTKLSSQKEGNLVRLNDARNNKLTSAEEIYKRNMHLVEEYDTNKQDDISGTNNQSGIFGYDLADCDELAHDDLRQVPQETFGYDIEQRNRLKYPFRKYAETRSNCNGN
jgi:hypothetical protein